MRKIFNFRYSLIFLLFFVNATLFVFTNPPFEAPDENHHLDYINYFAANLELPIQNIKNKRVAGEGHQNPLYYLITGGLIRIFSSHNKIEYELVNNQKHIWHGGNFFHTGLFEHNHDIFLNKESEHLFFFLRILSVCFGLINIYYFYKLLNLFEVKQKMNKFFSFSIFSFFTMLPQFIFVNSIISNDSLAFMFTTISIYYFYSFLLNKTNYFSLIITFFFLGLSVLTKFYALGLFFLFIYLILLVIRKEKDISHRITVLKYLGMGVLFFFVLVVPIVLRNISLYGKPFGYDAFSFNSKGLFEYDLIFIGKQILLLFISFVGKLGWLNVTLPYIIYFYYFIVFLIVFFKFFQVGVKKYFSKDLIFFSAFLGVLIVLFEILYFNFFNVQMQGRFLFPAIPFIALIFYFSFDYTSKFNNHKKLFLMASTLNILISFYSIYFNYQFYH